MTSKEEEINEHQVYFKLHDFTCDVSKITQLLNIEPSDAWNKGDMVNMLKNGTRKRKQNYSSWWLGRFTSKIQDLERHFNALLDQMLAKYDVLQFICKEYKAEPQMTIVSYYYFCNFGTYLPPETIEKLSKLKASLDIDIYSFLSTS